MRDGARIVIAQEGLATVRLLRAPQGNALAFIASRSNERVLRVWDNGTLTTLSNDAPLAAWWSPDARQIAMITAVDEQQVRWNIVTLATQQRRSLQAFTPSEMSIGYMRYFDAYRISPWSNDGQWLLTTTTTIIQAQALDGGAMVPLVQENSLFGLNKMPCDERNINVATYIGCRRRTRNCRVSAAWLKFRGICG
jgi:hypothetical protein